MSDLTIRSLFDRINSERLALEANTRTLERAPPFERPRWKVQIASSDQDLRNQLDAIQELPDLLSLVPRLREGWPYPSEETQQVARAELAHRARKPLSEIENLPLGELVTLLGGSPPKQPPSRTSPTPRKTISGPDVASLPRWARVAFAARSARRVERLLEEVAPQTFADESECYARAIQLAEESASTANPTPRIAEVAEKAQALADQAKALPQANGKTTLSLANLLRSTIGGAATASARAAAVADNLEHAYVAYLMAAQVGHALSSTPVLEGMLRDFDYLEAKSRKENWTDETPVQTTTIPQPSLKLVAIHVRNLRAIHRLDLPKDGLGWLGITPDLMFLAGINGTGKTTLLNFIAAALELLTQGEHASLGLEVFKPFSEVEEAWLEFEIQSYEIAPFRFRIVVGSEIFIAEHGGQNYWGFSPHGVGLAIVRGIQIEKLTPWVAHLVSLSTIPTVVYLPSEKRNLIVPGTNYKAAGKLTEDKQFVHRWQPPDAWKDSLEAMLYGLRWEDLNAKEEGKFTEQSHFNAYAEAFRRFTGDAKSLRFVDGRLVVSITDSGATHDLADLSSGERQMLLLTGELLRYWRPGSLILIDEPELHLHTRWQTQFYEAIRFWQKERGGQVIIATQSAHLASLAGVGASVLLGMDSL